MAVAIGVLCWTIMSVDGVAIKSAEVDDSGVVHITANGRQYEVPKERGQTGVAQLRISQDGRIAGWLV
jgi:hypothetical protein